MKIKIINRYGSESRIYEVRYNRDRLYICKRILKTLLGKSPLPKAGETITVELTAKLVKKGAK